MIHLKKFLLPRFFRYTGYTLLLIWLAAFIYIIFAMSDQFYDVSWISAEVTMLRVSLLNYHLPVIGFILCLISKEKVEDEMSLQLRMQSFLLGLIVIVGISFVLLIYSIIWNPMQIYLSRAGLPSTLFVVFIVHHYLKWKTSRYEK